MKIDLLKRTLGFVQVMQREFYGSEYIEIDIDMYIPTMRFVVCVSSYEDLARKSIEFFAFSMNDEDEKIKETYYKLKKHIEEIICETADLGCLAGF